VASSPQDALAGFVQLYPLFSSTRLKKLWLLNDLYVDEMFRGQRISIMLIDEAKRLAMETNSAGLILETAKSNVIGNQLYIRTGFELDKDHHYYSWEFGKT
jgi:ribosomal protein S18 acetylase RimI-like enzyme